LEAQATQPVFIVKWDPAVVCWSHVVCEKGAGVCQGRL